MNKIINSGFFISFYALYIRFFYPVFTLQPVFVCTVLLTFLGKTRRKPPSLAPDRLDLWDLQASCLEIWGKPCRGRSRDDCLTLSLHWLNITVSNHYLSTSFIIHMCVWLITDQLLGINLHNTQWWASAMKSSLYFGALIFLHMLSYSTATEVHSFIF